MAELNHDFNLVDEEQTPVRKVQLLRDSTVVTFIMLQKDTGWLDLVSLSFV